jgi:7-cyano-7-deazaguanine synthase
MNDSQYKDRDVLVVLSGGQDSTTCLSWALAKFRKVHAITFNYNQKHDREINSAGIIALKSGIESWEQIDLGPVLKGTSPLVNSDNSVGSYASADELPGGVEPTFVPGRNALFLVIAANRAVALGIHDIVTGVCEEDYGGYFDCRRLFIDCMVNALSQGFFGEFIKFNIHTPLMNLTKKETVHLARNLPGCWELLSHTHTCYNGQFPPCGTCHACILRARGFAEAGEVDPLLEGVS